MCFGGCIDAWIPCPAAVKCTEGEQPATPPLQDPRLSRAHARGLERAALVAATRAMGSTLLWKSRYRSPQRISAWWRGFHGIHLGLSTFYAECASQTLAGMRTAASVRGTRGMPACGNSYGMPRDTT